jgi:hypothetical protein
MSLQVIRHPQNDVRFCDMFITPTKCHIVYSSLKSESDSDMLSDG